MRRFSASRVVPLAVVFGLLAAPHTARAQDIALSETSGIPLNLDVAVPESPAFTGLGLAPETVTRPATPREFATSLLSGLDENGHFQAGLALDTVPYMLVWGNDLTLADYREHPTSFNLRRQLARTQMSLATTKGTDDDDDAVRLALGLRITPWSRGDPRLDDALVRCFKDVAASLPGRPESDTPFEPMPEGSLEGEPGGDVGAAIGQYLADVEAWAQLAEQRSEACVSASEKRLEKASAWDIGFAPAWIQQDGSNDDVRWGGATVWTSFAYGFEEWFVNGESDERGADRQPQLIAHVRFRFDERAAHDDAPNGFVEHDSLRAGLRLRIGATRLPLSVEAAYVYEDPDDLSSTSSFRGSLSADIPLWEQIWLQVALGGSAGRDEDKIQIGATLKWGGQSHDLSKIVAGFDDSNDREG